MNNKLFYGILAVIIIVVILLFFAFGLNGSKKQSLEAFDQQPVPSSVLALLRVPQNVSQAIGIGVATPPVKISGTPMQVEGKPVVVYVGAEYCPYCAAQRWPLTIALMRFGNFTNLKYTLSDPNDVFANTPTFTFYGSSYSSQYVVFMPVETTNRTGTRLETPNALQNATFSAYDLNNPAIPKSSRGSIPFTDFGNSTMILGSSYQPTSLQNLNWSQIATAINDPSTLQSQSIIGAANLMTAQICMLINNSDANVCGQQYIKSIEKSIG
ncbi:MAG: DUF929 family protein [Candidatus Micrarchaeota archaeon]|nr:DUF929 family protein [Candidatus Micrarchaeota archaeon]